MAKKLNIQAALMQSGANIAGGVAAAAVNKVGFIKKQKMVIRGAAKLVLGAFLPSLLKLKGQSAETANSAIAGWNAVAGIEMVNGLLTKNGANPDKALSISGVGNAGNIMGNDYAPNAVYQISGDEAPAGAQSDIM